MGCKLLIEAPVNGGRNYNGAEVAKFRYLPWVVGGVLLVATSFFFLQFFSPSRRLHNELDAAIRKVGESKQRLSCGIHGYDNEVIK